MDNSERDLEDLFNDRFKEDEASVSNRVWDNIKQTLPKDSRDTGSFWNFNKRLLSIILALFVVSGISFLFFEKINRRELSNLDNIEQKTQNRKHRTGNTEQEKGKNIKNETKIINKTENTELKTEKNIKSETKNDFISMSGPNKNTFTKKKKHTSNYNNFISEKNKNTISKNNKTSELPTNFTNKGLQENYLVAENSLEQTKINSRKNRNTTIQQKSTIKNKYTPNNANSAIIANTELSNKDNPDENLNSATHRTDSKITISNKKSDEKINFNSSYLENKKENKIDTLNKSSLKNDLNKITTSNPDVLSDAFSDAAIVSKSKNTETPIIFKADSTKQLSAIKENRESTKNPDPTLFASISSVSEKDSTQPDSSVKQVTVDDTLASGNKKEKDKKKALFLSKLSFDLLISPGITGMSVAPNLMDSISQLRTEHKKNNSANKITLSGGLRVNYSISQKLNVSLGIFYTNYSQTYTMASRSETSNVYTPDSSLVGSKQDTLGSDSLGHPILGPPHKVYNHFNSVKTTTSEYPGKTVTDHYTFISIPLTVSYAFINKKIGIVCIGGVTTNILIKGVSHYINDSFTDLISNTKFTSTSLGATGGIGLSYRFTKHLSFLIEPRVNYFLSNLETSSSFIKQKPHSINVNAGLRFRF